MSLLSIEADAKTIKGTSRGYLTGILYLAPAREHGLTDMPSLCPFSTPGCRASCLFTAGRARMFATINAARVRKARVFLTDRPAFMSQLHSDVAALVRAAERRGLAPAVRLNGTSDVTWERVGYTHEGVSYASPMQAFPHVQFYDYTKIPITRRRNRPANYHLTFSLSERNEADAKRALTAGVNVAAVFPTRDFPPTYLGTPVIVGDESDLRFTDPRGVVVALYAKGSAKHDASGFVQ